MLSSTQNPLHPSVDDIDPERLLGDKIQPGHPLFGLVWINPKRLSGAPCFYRTRVPLSHLFEFMAEGASLEEFLESFPGVKREQALGVLKIAGEDLLSDLVGL